MKKLNVIYNGWGESWVLGQLADNNKQLLFEYSSEALNQALELSPLHLKLRKEAYSDFPNYQMRLPGLIFDCLPDGWGLYLMDKLFRRSQISLETVSPLDRLRIIGLHGVGALSFEPADEYLHSMTSFTLLDLGKTIHSVVNEEATTILAELVRLGGSAQGARPKVLINFDSRTKKINSDPSGSGVPWIFKFQAKNEHKEVCAIECLYSRIAMKAGLAVSECQYFDLGKSLSAFGAKRFDREKQMRIPIHSLAGALQVDFRIPGSTSYINFLRLTRFVTKSEVDVVKALRQCIFNVLLNNRDDHPKNFSYLLSKEKKWQLSPAYDLTFSAGPGGEHQMDIQGEGKEPALDHLLSLATEAGIKKKVVLEIIEEIIEVAMAFKKEASHFPIRKTTITEIYQQINKNIIRIKPTKN